MSAYLVDETTIGQIAQFAVEACQYGKCFENPLTKDAQTIAEVLALENIKSVRARYNKGAPYTLDDQCEFWDDRTYGEYIDLCKAAAGITYNSMRHALIMDKVMTYDYQACEDRNYHESMARVILEQIAWKIACDFARSAMEYET